MERKEHLNIFQMRDLVRKNERDLPSALHYYLSLFREGVIDKAECQTFNNTIMSGYLINKTILINMEEKMVRLV